MTGIIVFIATDKRIAVIGVAFFQYTFMRIQPPVFHMSQILNIFSHFQGCSDKGLDADWNFRRWI